ncbi:hypothetical protein IEI92_05585 [Microbispora bryophytorum]|uniref:DUF91 domain-containing protein n=1 Tax=Microbispora bryophytorum TaxID=1460882 RepID=A0A8H9GVV2_9ACTN|nr:hypothetical protein [Microbispora bryophytorum]MBD3135756.1 hypothetical protein [Microbispora bryophytorum]GGN99321.1 hypothetical protein GCM10011574_04840 [Microbispora bryophytorum]
MTGIWHDEGKGLVPLPAQRYADEQALHSSIERAPAMLPLPGQPRLVILGREVQLGNGYADLVAVDADSGRPVVIEVKLAANSDRRTVFAQVLGYASYIFRLSATAFEELMQPYVTKRGHATVAALVAAEVGDGSFDIDSFRNGMAEEFEKGNARCVVVFDAAPTDLIELAGYLQTVTNDRLDIDLVTVTAYDVGGSQVLVPQLVEPERALAASISPSRMQREAKPTSGSASFRDSIDSADPSHRELLRRLCDWAEQLQSDRLTTLFTTVGKGRWILNPRLPGQSRGMFTIWNDGGAYVSPQRTVIQAEAPNALARLDERLPGQIGQNNYLKCDINDEVLALLRSAYEESANRRTSAEE